jgi:hypothetical protein
MASMDKATTIFGEQKQITPMAFNTQHMNEIEATIQSAIGFDWKLKRGEVSRAVEAARQDPLLKVGYVKVGLVTGHMVMRFKEKSSSGKHSTDLILVKDYTAKAAARGPASAAPSTGTPAPKGAATNWGSLSVGNMSEEAAEKALVTADDGAWFVRHGLGNALTVSVREGEAVRHYPVAEAEALNLDQAKGLSAQQVGHQPRLDPMRLAELERMDGFFARLDRAGAERLLAGAGHGAWLVRGTGRPGEIIWSRKNGTKVEHAVINDDRRYNALQAYRGTAGALQVRP